MPLSPADMPPDAPTRWIYLPASVLLALVLVLEVAFARVATSAAGLSLASVVDELRLQAPMYGYVGGTALAMLALVASWLVRREDCLWRAAGTDPATGLGNRRWFDRQIGLQIGRARRSHGALALLFVDVDGLKATNDRFGHQAGDAALRLVADSLRRTCRRLDVAARWGGDEFVLLLPDAGASDAFAVAERLRGTLARLAAERHTGEPSPTVSIGVGDLASVRSRSAEGLVASADRALYAAKRRGRDRTVIAFAPSVTEGLASRAARMREAPVART